MPTKVVSRNEWVTASKDLLAKEKEHTRAREALAAERRNLPMVQVDKDYVFDGPSGKVKLLDLFEGRRQLVIYHFMFDPNNEAGCSSCSFLMDHVAHLEHLHSRDTSFAAISRAPLEKITAFKKRMGWEFPWYSSFSTEFNYDFHVTQDEAVAPVEYNFKNKAELEKAGCVYNTKGEQPGLSVFVHDGDKIYHSYSSYSRGLDQMLTTYTLLDLTPLGRQDEGRRGVDFKYHDEYTTV